MGGFGDVLGHVAGGFEQARQQDLTRQFADEQNRRTFMGDALQKLAFDPNQHPDVRNAALQSYIQLGQTPWNKQVDVKKMFDPVVQAHTAAAAVQPPTQTSTVPSRPVPGTTSTLPAISAPPLPAGVSGPTQQLAPPTTVQGRGGMTMPQQAQFTPPPTPPPSLLAGMGEIASNQANLAGQVAGGQLTSQIAARQQAINEMMAQHPELANDPTMQQFLPMLMLGGSMPYGMFQMGMTGPETNMTGAQARANPAYAALMSQHPEIRDDEFVQVTRNRANQPISVQAITPTAMLPNVQQGFKQVQQADGSIALVPTTTTSQRVIPNQQSKPPAPPSTTVSAPPTPPSQRKGRASAPTPSRSVGSPIAVGHTAPSPEVQKQTQEQVQMRNQTVDIIDDIMRNKSLFDSLISSGKIQVAANPDGSGVVQRAADLTPEEARVASDFAQLAERVNILRLPLGGGGFRSGEAWAALQGLRGKPTGDPQMTQNILRGTRSALVGLNDADMKMMQGKGTDTTAMEPTVGGHKVGDVVGHRNGRDLKITKIYPDGTFDADEVKK